MQLCRLILRNDSMLEPYRDTTVSIPVSDGSREHTEVENITRNRAALCAAIALEPVPLLDLAIVLPLHLNMIVQIGKVYGFDLSRERAREITLEFSGAIAMTYATRTATRSLLKFVPVLGPVLNAPMVFTSTYALGMLAERYFRARRADLPPLEKATVQNLTREFISQGKRSFQNVKLEDWRRIAMLLLKRTR